MADGSQCFMNIQTRICSVTSTLTQGCSLLTIVLINDLSVRKQNRLRYHTSRVVRISRFFLRRRIRRILLSHPFVVNLLEIISYHILYDKILYHVLYRENVDIINTNTG